MPLSGHLAELAEKHRALELKIEEAQAHPSISDLEITRLKREKLRIKDQITRLQDATRH